MSHAVVPFRFHSSILFDFGSIFSIFLASIGLHFSREYQTDKPEVESHKQKTKALLMNAIHVAIVLHQPLDMQ